MPSFGCLGSARGWKAKLGFPLRDAARVIGRLAIPANSNEVALLPAPLAERLAHPRQHLDISPFREGASPMPGRFAGGSNLPSLFTLQLHND
ncbi:MAG: hypothetical protein ACQESR_20800 [Planctomycetota bacterium]